MESYSTDEQRYGQPAEKRIKHNTYTPPITCTEYQGRTLYELQGLVLFLRIALYQRTKFHILALKTIAAFEEIFSFVTLRTRISG